MTVRQTSRRVLRSAVLAWAAVASQAIWGQVHQRQLSEQA